MVDLCKYKELFGKPGSGIRQYRIFDIAIFDTVFVIVSCLLITYLTGIPLIVTLAIVFAFGIAIHRIFCVRTGVDKMLFPNPVN